MGLAYVISIREILVFEVIEKSFVPVVELAECQLEFVRLSLSIKPIWPAVQATYPAQTPLSGGTCIVN